MTENDNLITFDFIWECWKNKIYPSDFDEQLQHYLDLKARIFETVPIKEHHKNVPMWFTKIAVSIEIGLQHDEKKFVFYKNYWENILKQKWLASIEDQWVVFEVDESDNI